MAQLAVANDVTCASATDASDICMGSCRTLIDDVINNCDATDPVSEYLINSYLAGL